MIIDNIKKFVDEMQKAYPQTVFRYEYNKEDDMYRIWHTYQDVYTDMEFTTAMGKKIKELFIPEGFFNFYIDLNTSYKKDLMAMKSPLDKLQYISNQCRIESSPGYYVKSNPTNIYSEHLLKQDNPPIIEERNNTSPDTNNYSLAA